MGRSKVKNMVEDGWVQWDMHVGGGRQRGKEFVGERTREEEETADSAISSSMIAFGSAAAAFSFVRSSRSNKHP